MPLLLTQKLSFNNDFAAKNNKGERPIACTKYYLSVLLVIIFALELMQVCKVRYSDPVLLACMCTFVYLSSGDSADVKSGCFFFYFGCIKTWMLLSAPLGALEILP